MKKFMLPQKLAVPPHFAPSIFPCHPISIFVHLQISSDAPPLLLPLLFQFTSTLTLHFLPSLPSSHTSLLPLFSPIKSIPIDANFFYCLSTSTNSSTTFATWSSSTTISSSLSISTFSFSSTSFLSRDQPNIRFWHYFRWINLWLFCVVSDILHYTATVLLLGLQLDLPVCVYRPTINLTTA